MRADAIADRVLREGALVPALWSGEIGNALLNAERRGRIERARLVEILEELAALPIALEERGPQPTFGASIDLARKFDLTVYDATYLELALRLSAPLATRDAAISAAATAVGVLLVE